LERNPDLQRIERHHGPPFRWEAVRSDVLR
jgi:hypothetical protein